MNEFASPWATGSNRSTPHLEAENPFAYIPSTLAPHDVLVEKTSRHKAHESVWSTFTNDASVWSDGAENHTVKDVWGAEPADIEASRTASLEQEEPGDDIQVLNDQEEQTPDTEDDSETKAQSHEDPVSTFVDSNVTKIDGESASRDRGDEVESTQASSSVDLASEELGEINDLDGTQDTKEKPPQAKLADEEGAVETVEGGASPTTTVDHEEQGQEGKLESAQLQEDDHEDNEQLSKEGKQGTIQSVVKAEDAYRFKFDQNLYDHLFTLSSSVTKEQQDLEEADDQIISSTSERKAWYRISREGTMREHDDGNINYIRVLWKDSAIQRKATGIVERWIQEDRSTVGSNLFSTTMKSSVAFNWSDAPTSPHNHRKPSISQIKTHSRQTTQTSFTPSTATARSSLHSDRGAGLGFSWSSEKNIQDPPTPPSSAGLAKSPSAEFKTFKFEPANRQEAVVQEVIATSTHEDTVAEDEDDDFGDFEQSSPVSYQVPSDPVPSSTLPAHSRNHSNDPAIPASFDLPDSGLHDKASTHYKQMSTSSMWDVLEPTRSPTASPRTSMVVEEKSVYRTAKSSNTAAHEPSSQNPVHEETDPWGALASFEQTAPSTPKTSVMIQPSPIATAPTPRTTEVESPPPLEIIGNLPDLSFMLL